MNKIRIVTTKCSEFKHPEFQLEFESTILRADVDVLVCYLEQTVQGGTRYGDGQTIAFGSMLFRLAAQDGLLALQEPDLKSFPIFWEMGITNSMKLLRLQKDIADSFGLGDEVDPPSLLCSLLVGADLSPNCDMLVLERSTYDGSDSGWFFGRLNTELDYNDAATLRRISVYQAILNWPHLPGFLALPAGSRIEMSKRSKIVLYHDRPLMIQKGSFLDVAGFAQ
jgi:hypothetical protein